MAEGRGNIEDPLSIDNAKVWRDSNGNLRLLYDSDGEPPDADSDGAVILLADGSVAMEADLDLDGNDLDNVNALNGNDDYLQLLSTAAGGLSLGAGLKLVLDKGTGNVSDYWDSVNSRRVITIGGSAVIYLDADSIDIRGLLLKNPAGLGGATGKAEVYVSDVAGVIAANIDANVSVVKWLPGTYTFTANAGATACAVLSNKKNIGLGEVIADWSGGAGGYIFRNDTGDNISFENIYWAKSGNSYLPIRVRDNFKMRDCHGVYTGSYIQIIGDNPVFEDNYMETAIQLTGGTKAKINGGSYGYIRITNYSQVTLSNFTITTNYLFIDNSAYGSPRLINIDKVIITPDSNNHCIRIYQSAGVGDLSVLNVTNCYMKPATSAYSCIYLDNYANNNTSSVSFDNNEFDTAAFAFNILNGTHTKWLRGRNKYIGGTVIENPAGAVIPWVIDDDNV